MKGMSKKRALDIAVAYIENDMEGADPDYVRSILIDAIGVTRKEAEEMGLEDFLYEED